MTDKQLMVLKYIKEVFKSKDAYELYRQVEKLGMIIRQDANYESNPKKKFKSIFSDEPK